MLNFAVFSYVQQSNANDINGTWISVRSGCNLHLDKATIEKLPYSGGLKPRLTSFSLTIKDNKFSTRFSNSYLCFGRNPGVYQLDELKRTLRCYATDGINSGQVKFLGNNDYYFDGKTTQFKTLSTERSRHYLGISIKRVQLRRKGPALILKTPPQSLYCDGQYIAYYIRPPLS